MNASHFDHYRVVEFFSSAARLIVAGDFDIFNLTETERRLVLEITAAIEKYEISKVQI